MSKPPPTPREILHYRAKIARARMQYMPAINGGGAEAGADPAGEYGEPGGVVDAEFEPTAGARGGR